jgi:hypothetical protein
MSKLRNATVRLRRERYNLAKLVERITRTNLHYQVDFGAPVGKEEWSQGSDPPKRLRSIVELAEVRAKLRALIG